MKILLINSAGDRRWRELPSMLTNAINNGKPETRLQAWMGAALTVALAEGAAEFQMEIDGWKFSTEIRRLSDHPFESGAGRILMPGGN